MILAVYISAILLLPLVLWLFSVGNVLEYMDEAVPAGQLLYIFSKLAGLLALSLLTLQISLMSLRRISNARRLVALNMRWNIERHGVLGSVVILCASLHAGLFFLAASARSEHWTWHLLLPRFQSGFYDAMVSLGAMALYVVVIVGFLGWYSRIRRNYSPWHRIAVLICTVLVIIHSYAIGSETHTLALRLYYVVLMVILLGSAVSLIRTHARNPSHA